MHDGGGRDSLATGPHVIILTLENTMETDREEEEVGGAKRVRIAYSHATLIPELTELTLARVQISRVSSDTRSSTRILYET